MTMILRDTRSTLAVVFSTGTADGPVTYTVTDADGDTVTTGTATPAGAGYAFQLPAQPDVADLMVSWSGSFGGFVDVLTFPVWIVGAQLFTIADLRAINNGELDDPGDYPDAALQFARQRATDLFEQVCAVSFVPRYGRRTFDGNGRDSLWLPAKRVVKLLSVEVDGYAYSQQQIDALYVYPNGRVRSLAGWPCTLPRGITVGYEHGHVYPPSLLTQAGLLLARYELVSGELSDRALSLSNDLGSVRLSVPGPSFPTGLPVVDSTLYRWSEALLEVGA